MVETCNMLTAYGGPGVNWTINRLGVCLTPTTPFSSCTSVSFWLNKVNWGSTGTKDIYCKIYNSSNVLRQTSTTSMNTDGLPDYTIGYEKRTFAIDSSIPINDGDFIVIEVPGIGSTVGPEITVQGKEGGSPEFTNNIFYKYNTASTTWTSLSGSCTYCRVAAGPSSGGTRLPPPPLIARF